MPLTTRMIFFIGCSMAIELDTQLEQVEKKLNATVEKQSNFITRWFDIKLTDATEWSACGSSDKITKATFDNILVFGRPRDTPDGIKGTFDYSKEYEVASEFEDKHAQPNWRECDTGIALNMFRGPCVEAMACGSNTCSAGDYCGWDRSANHTCIKMYPKDTNDTFGSPTKLKLREVDAVRKTLDEVLPQNATRCLHNVECSVDGYDCEGQSCPCTRTGKNCGNHLHCVTEDDNFFSPFYNDEPRWCLPYSKADRIVNGLLGGVAAAILVSLSGGALAITGGVGFVAFDSGLITLGTGKIALSLAGVVMAMTGGITATGTGIAALVEKYNDDANYTTYVDSLKELVVHNAGVSAEDLQANRGWLP